MYSAHSTFSASRLGHSGPASRGSGHGVVARGSIARRFGAQARQAAEAAAAVNKGRTEEFTEPRGVVRAIPVEIESEAESRARLQGATGWRLHTTAGSGPATRDLRGAGGTRRHASCDGHVT